MTELPYIEDNVVHPITDDWAVLLKINSPSDPDTPLDITGWEIYLVITKDLSWDDSEAYIFKSFSPTNPLDGEAYLVVGAEEFKDTGLFYRGIKVKTSSGTRSTLVSGTFELVAAGPKVL